MTLDHLKCQADLVQAELSEDGGHSDDDSGDDGDAAEQEKLLVRLLGSNETEKQPDSKLARTRSPSEALPVGHRAAPQWAQIPHGSVSQYCLHAKIVHHMRSVQVACYRAHANSSVQKGAERRQT